MGEEFMCHTPEHKEFKKSMDRVREEVKIRRWRSKTRNEYSDRCYQDRR
jgi:hypothetical protein